MHDIYHFFDTVPLYEEEWYIEKATILDSREYPDDEDDYYDDYSGPHIDTVYQLYKNDCML